MREEPIPDFLTPLRINARCTAYLYHWAEPESVYQENVDAEIDLLDGRRYAAFFATLDNIAALMERDRTSGESAGGRYFGAADLIIVRELTLETIRASLRDLYREDGLRFLCQRLDTDEEE